MNIKYSIL